MSSLFDAIARRAEPALKSEMEKLKTALQKRISVPVVRTGGRTIRSKPGEPPRKDTGRLHASADAQTISGNRTIQGSVSLSTPYVLPLSKIRPIPGPLLKQQTQSILATCRRAIVAKD